MVLGDESMAYGELNARANRLAYYLMGLGVGPEKMIGICLERSVDMVVALLGTLKAGGAYLPLDPDYPAARGCAQMVEDAAPTVVLTTIATKACLPATVETVCSIQEKAHCAGPGPGQRPHRCGPHMPAPFAAPCLCHLHVGLHRRTQGCARTHITGLSIDCCGCRPRTNWMQRIGYCKRRRTASMFPRGSFSGHC